LAIKHMCNLRKVQKLHNNKPERESDVREEHKEKEMKRKNTFTVSGACMLESKPAFTIVWRVLKTPCPLFPVGIQYSGYMLFYEES